MCKVSTTTDLNNLGFTDDFRSYTITSAYSPLEPLFQISFSLTLSCNGNSNDSKWMGRRVNVPRVCARTPTVQWFFFSSVITTKAIFVFCISAVYSARGFIRTMTVTAGSKNEDILIELNNRNRRKQMKILMISRVSAIIWCYIEDGIQGTPFTCKTPGILSTLKLHVLWGEINEW